MTYNTIMVHLDVGASAVPRTTFAMDLARQFRADLIGFAAAGVHVFVPRDETGLVTAEMLRQRTQEIEEAVENLRNEFLNLADKDGQVSWRSDIGNPTQLLAIHARAADLIITGSPTSAVASDNQRIDPGALILSAGRPVLFAADTLATIRAQRVLVAWKDTREARRAVLDAMPFLKRAHNVAVVSIAESDQIAARESTADVARFIIRHGVKASSHVLGAVGANPEDALAKIAGEMGADLIVAGGYGHSRVREWAFGGVTRSLLDDGSLHRLIAN